MPAHLIERRQNVVYLTRFSEYHCHQDECVGVRDRRTGQWKRAHRALRSRLVGGTHDLAGLAPIPSVGQRLIFVAPAASDSVLTSTITAKGRPPKEAIWSYATFAKSGLIETQT